MHLTHRLTVLFAAAWLLAACSRVPTPADLPIVYKIDVEQGNVITQDMLARLRPGMDKSKVRFVMGTPIIVDTFHSNRWDYVYSLSERGGRPVQRRVALFFEDDKLVRVEGNVKAAEGTLEPQREKSAMVEVPGQYERSLIDKMKARVGLGDEAPDKEDAAEAAGNNPEEDGQGLFARMARTVGLGGEEQGDEAAGDSEQDAAAQEADEDAAGDESSQRMGAQQAKAESSVLVPEDEPPPKRKKGFFKSLLEKVGIGDEDDEEPATTGAPPPEPGYPDPTATDEPF